MLELKQICKRFGSKIVSDNISLSVASGSILAILGPSGCGKSTLLNIAAGLVEPDSGEVWINGENRTHTPPEKRRVALMFQDYALFPHLNAWQNVAFGLKMQGISKEEARVRAEEALASVGLAAETERQVDALSGGEKQRVALARALAVSPQLLLLDEPFSSLDTGLRQQLREQTQAQIRRQKVPAILVTHDPEEALALADYLALMNKGRLIQYGKPQEVLQRPVNAWVAKLLGADNVNETRYIPQHALVFNHEEGQPSEILQITPNADYCRLLLLHPQYGEIVLNLDWQRVGGKDLKVGEIWNILISANQIAYF